MKVTAKIKLDLRSQNYGSSVYAVQGDGGSRCVEAALLDGGKPWNVPAGVTAAVAYKKPDFTKGLYDKLADDTPAVTVSGSTVTVVLAKQMLTVPGSVQACIVFNNAALDQLTTFPLPLRWRKTRSSARSRPMITSGCNGWRTSWTNTSKRLQKELYRAALAARYPA